MPELRFRRSRRGLCALALAVAAVSGLAACGGIPTSGTVSAGNLINDDVELDIGFAPQGPRVDATQEEIMTDFIAAATNPQADYQIAREFLTKGFASKWNPDAITTIRSGVTTSRRVSETTVDYTLTTTATVNRDGRYDEAEPATSVLEFTFVKEGKQWRISQAPDGIVLSQDSFGVVFGQYALYYFDPTFQYLVPDIRWFPNRNGTANRVVAALLSGQAGWLGNGVLVSAFPAGTALGDGLVDITSNVATVDLTDEARSAATLARQRMRQQLSATLSSVSSVSSVIITVGGIPVATPDSGANVATSTFSVEPAPLILRDASFGFVTNSEIAPVSQISAKVVALGATAVTLARGKGAAAVRGADGAVYSVRAGAAPALLVDNRPGLVAPSIDDTGFVWSVPAGNAAALTVFEPDGTAHAVASPLSPDARVVSFSLSRDSTRVLFYLATSFGPQLVVAGVIRQDGVPVSLGEPLVLPVDGLSPIDAAWVDDRTVATLSASDDETVVTAYEIGGPTTQLGQFASGSTIVGGNGGTDGLRVLTTDGQIFRPRGASWQKTGISASVLATQQ